MTPAGGGQTAKKGGTMKIIMVEPGKPAYVTEIGDGLKDMQKVVGGLIEAIYPHEELVGLVMNEEGKLDGLPPNRALRDNEGEIYDVICGSFFVAGLSDDNFCSIPDELIPKFLDIYRGPETFFMVNGKIVALKERGNY